MLERKSRFYLGGETDWREDSHFERVRYSEIYPGIDLVFITNAGLLEYNFEVAPHADPRAIRIRIEGATISLDREGDVEIHAPSLTIVQQHPRAFQSGADHEHPVACRYVLASRQEARLHTGPYDRNAPLTIDPTLSFSTYIGGSGFDVIYGIATDASGNLYVAGETSSGGLWNNALPARSSRDAFVAKMNSTATQVLYTVYLGGSGDDAARAIAVDATGNVYVTGVTASPDFPVTTGAFSTSLSGTQSAFVAKLDSMGRLQYSTYLGGANPDFGVAIAIDSSGAAYLAGQTESPTFPVTAGAFQNRYHGGSSDCFVSKLNPSGSALIYSTFLGGSGLDACAGIAVDSAGNAYVTGTTYSTDFPTQLAFQALLGTANAFVSKINASGSALVFSTFVGGTNMDQANAIAVDPTGSAYIAGSTTSIDFPVTAGVFQGTLKGTHNAFVAKLAANGSSLTYSTLIGGSQSDTATSIAVDQAGRAIIGGFTSSPDFPLANAVHSAFQGSNDAFASVLDPQGASLVFSSYFGGSGDDRGYAVSLLPGDNFYLAGLTLSGNFPTVAAMQPGLNVAPDAFLVEVSGVVPAALSISKTHSGNFTQGQQNAAYTVTVSNAAGAGPTNGTVTVTETLPSGLSLVSMLGSGWSCSSATCSRSDVLSGGSSYPAITVTVDVSAGATSPQVNLVSVSGGASATAAVTDSTTIAAGGGTGGLSDLAVNQTATQSSTYEPGVTDAPKAVDGNTDGRFGDRSVSHTNLDANAWWQVDLGSSATVSSIVVWNRTDCCGNRLSDYWVFVSNTPFASTDTPTTLQNRAGTWSSHQTVQPNPSTSITVPSAQGRYVRVQLSAANYLSLAEVQILGNFQAAQDLAVNRPCTQSSTLVQGYTDASQAVDGNTDGAYADGSLTHTNLDVNAWWQVDLGASATVSSIMVWNRTDCCGSRLNDYWVFVSDTPFGATDTPATLQNRAGTWSSHQTAAPNPSATVAIAEAQGRYVRVQLSGANYLSLAEVQIFGNFQAAQDLAVNRPCTQSSTLVRGYTDASQAVDGNTDGAYADGSLTHTNLDVNAWWQVDLGASATVSSIVVWNRTDCCGSRLNDYWVFVSDTPFGAIDTPATLQSRAGTWSSHQTAAPNPSATVTIAEAQGRYVRVQLSGTNYLSLAEVQIFGNFQAAQDLAVNRPCTQSSTLVQGYTDASKAVDGNTDGNFGDGSVSHTNMDANAWWEVDLGSSATVSSIVVWNRTDCCGGRLSDYWVFVSNTPFLSTDTPATLQNRAGTWSSHQTVQPNPSTSITVPSAQGRYVRVQLSGSNYLSLAEVQVFGQ